MTDRDDDAPDDELPSRSERKRQTQDVTDLGWQLVSLPEADLAGMPLPDDVRDAVETARRITSHGALARQRLYIGKLLRRIDVVPIRVALENRGIESRRRIEREKDLEHWRDRLLADEAEAWAAIGGRVDPAVLRELRSLARQARAERTAERPPAATRKLFRRLREALPAEG
ncbi:MAG: ribosome biogenesis factor YjgA [Steroidobacteraceae bacterium]